MRLSCAAFYLPATQRNGLCSCARFLAAEIQRRQSYYVPQHVGVRHSTKIPKCGTHLSPHGFIFLLTGNIIHQVDLPESIKFISRAHLNFLGDKYFMTTRTQSLVPVGWKICLNLICHSRCALRDESAWCASRYFSCKTKLMNWNWLEPASKWSALEQKRGKLFCFIFAPVALWNVLDWCGRVHSGECAAADIRLVIQIYGLALCTGICYLVPARANSFSAFFLLTETRSRCCNEIASLLRTIQNDLWNALGRDHPREIQFSQFYSMCWNVIKRGLGILSAVKLSQANKMYMAAFWLHAIFILPKGKEGVTFSVNNPFLH